MKENDEAQIEQPRSQSSVNESWLIEGTGWVAIRRPVALRGAGRPSCYSATSKPARPRLDVSGSSSYFEAVPLLLSLTECKELHGNPTPARHSATGDPRVQA